MSRSETSRRIARAHAAFVLLVCTGCPFEKQSAKDVEDPTKGSLSMGLALPDQTEVGSVDYTITKCGEPVTSGKMGIGNDGVASVTVNGLEPGNDYETKLSARRMLNLPCVGRTDFVVRAGKTDDVNVVFQCEALNDPYDPED